MHKKHILSPLAAPVRRPSLSVPKITLSHYGDKWLVALLVPQNINGYCLVDSSFNRCGMLIKDITYSFILYFSFYFLLFYFFFIFLFFVD